MDSSCSGVDNPLLMQINHCSGGRAYIVVQRFLMRVNRAIIAILVALSVAMLPATAGFATASTSAGAAMTDCCHHHGMPCNNAVDDGQTMATCALHCFNYVGPNFSGFELVSVVAKTKPSFASRLVRSHTASPPFHPPRV
jgi:hypothetical protein